MMKPPTNDDAADLADARRRDEAQASGQRSDSTSPRPFAVIAIKPRGARIVVGRCTSIEEAQAQAAKHQRFVGVTGARIVVERDDGEEPEHQNDRRRFLVWAVLCGFAKPERLTERIVAEIEGGDIRIGDRAL